MQKIHIIYDGYFLTEDFKSKNKNENVIFHRIALKKQNFFLKVIRFLYFKLDLPKKNMWYEEIIDFSNINKQDTVILFDLCSNYYINYISEVCSGNEKKLWIWNSIDKISNNLDIEKISKKIPKKNIFTFNKIDAEKFNIQYINQFYWRSDATKKKEEKVFFVGIDKGRLEQIKDIKKLFPHTILKDFFIIPDKQKKYSEEDKKHLSEPLNYNMVLEKIKNSKYLLEINRENQDGLTIRALEALFFETKLITNNVKIKEYDFYHPSNIFVLEESTSKKELELFLKKEYVSIENEIKEKYYYTTWLEKILGKVQ